MHLLFLHYPRAKFSGHFGCSRCLAVRRAQNNDKISSTCGTLAYRMHIETVIYRNLLQFWTCAQSVYDEHTKPVWKHTSYTKNSSFVWYRQRDGTSVGYRHREMICNFKTSISIAKFNGIGFPCIFTKFTYCVCPFNAAAFWLKWRVIFQVYRVSGVINHEELIFSGKKISQTEVIIKYDFENCVCRIF